MSTKLEQIEQDLRYRYPANDPHNWNNMDWLIARVRKLETALRASENRLSHIFDTDVPSTGKFVYDIRDAMHKALKED